MALETQNRVVYEGESVRTTEQQEQLREPTREMMVKGGSGLATFAGLCTIVLGVLGLLNILPFYMACISAIVIGVGFLFEGRTASALRSAPRSAEISESGLGTQAIGGVAAIVLGVLALLGNSPMVLLSVSILVLGASLFVGSMGGGFSSANVFLGLSSLVLGVLCLMGYVPLTLVLVGFLCLGTASLSSGSVRLIPATRA